MNPSDQPVNRRQFLGLALLGGSTLALSSAPVEAATNPFAYRIDRFPAIDPKLIHYEKAASFPCGIAQARRLVISGDRLYVAGGKGVTFLDTSGKQMGALTTRSLAQAVAVAADKSEPNGPSVFVAVKDGIEVFNAKGDRTAEWKVEGAKTWLTGLAVLEEAIFAADSGQRVIWKLDRSGKVLAKLGVKNPDKNIPGLVVPSPYLQVQAGADGLLRVNNTGRHRVEVYTADGDLELAWGSPVGGVEGFCGCCNPVSIWMLPDGRCVTAEKGLPRIKIYATDGKLESVVAAPELFAQNARTGAARSQAEGLLGGLDVAADPKGQVYALDLVTAEISVFRRKTS